MSNIDVTPGSGKTVGTHTVSGIEYQQIEVIGQVSIIGTSSVSGTVGASIIGTVPITLGSSILTNVGSVIGAVTPYSQPGSFTQGVTSMIVTTASVVVLTAPGASLRNYVTHILATNAGAVGTNINISDNNSIIYSGYAAASGGGFSSSLVVPLKQPTTATALYAGTSATTSVLVSAIGYQAS